MSHPRCKRSGKNPSYLEPRLDLVLQQQWSAHKCEWYGGPKFFELIEQSKHVQYRNLHA
jgi:hypothetical protein